MGNSISEEHQTNRGNKTLKLRRQSNRSTFSNRFSSCSISSSNNKEAEHQHPIKDSHSSTNHGILSRLKNKNHVKSNERKPPISDIFTKTEDMMRSSSSTHSTLLYSSAQSMKDDFPIIEKYTDSQMTLLENKQQYHYQQLCPETGYSHDNQSMSSINSMSTARTTNDTNSSFTTCPQSYSSELMLKELYMLCETSPERRRDRDRRHRQHYLLKRIWGKNYQIPLENPSLIVDWCCATAVWDIELALEFPNAKIVGIDYESVTVASLTNTVNNFSFHNAMIHLGETGLKEFGCNQVDYIMMRDVWLVNTPACKWSSLLQEIYRILKPGGFIEIYEQDRNFKSMGPNLTVLEQWSDRFYEVIKLDRNTNSELDSYLENAGYINIKKKSIELPIGEWPDSKEMKETGFLQKDITERRFRESKRWYCKFNNLTEREYTKTLVQAMDECDDYSTTVRSFYFSAQKPPL
ncbi:S-adenosyl-L-methionine-dependent methyltransferase [Parasitella parasitica]|nr:S-adenosyl-L-methionine-dependent methyltransferase [Parasitella parasitica]